MIEYKTKNKNDCNTPELLNEMGKENWQLICIENGVMIFSRPIKITKTKKEVVQTKEYLEFKAIYKTIRNHGLDADLLINRYAKCVKEGLHKEILKNLEIYKTFLDIGDNKNFALKANNYIREKRFNDEWEVVKDMSKKWLDQLFKERELESHVIENCLQEVNAWEHKHSKEITTGIANNIIDHVLGIN